MKVNPAIASVVTPDSPAARAAFHVRCRIYRRLAELVPLESLSSVLDVGATADADADYSNFLECFYPHKERITALSDQDASGLEKLFPGLKFVRGDARELPFDDNSFDLVFSSAVLEHVGARAQQVRFLKEAMRVSRRYLFVTTPNRFHPLEFHTKLPLLHWLPKKLHRAVLRRMGLDYLSLEEHLNLLGHGELQALCREAGLTDVATHFVRFLGWPSNHLLFAVKHD